MSTKSNGDTFGDTGGIDNALVPRGIKWMSADEVHEAGLITDSDKEEKIQFIYDLKETFRWQDGQTHKDLAKIWDLSPAVVRGIAVAAGRHFRMRMGDPEEIQGAIFAKLEHIVTSAMNNQKALVVQVDKDRQTVEYVDAPDHKAGIAGLVAIGNLVGLNQKKMEVNVKYERMSSEKLFETMRAELEEKRQHLKAKPQVFLTEGKEADD